MNDTLFSLAGRVAVVSGAAQGLGRATALAVARYGADVVLVEVRFLGGGDELVEGPDEAVRVIVEGEVARAGEDLEPAAGHEFMGQIGM